MGCPDVSAPGLLSLEALYLEQGTLARALQAPRTRVGYGFDWRHFEKFCRARGLTALPASADTVALFAVDLLARERKTSTVRRLVAGITDAHRRQHQPVEWGERIDLLLAGARRLRRETLEQATPLDIPTLRAMSRELARVHTARALRNRAILVAGFASALRAASLVALERADLEFVQAGAVLRIRQEKNDQLGRGRLIGLPYGKHPETCPVGALRDWLARRGEFAGALFCHVDGERPVNRPLISERICFVVQDALRRIGSNAAGYGSHSLRAGLVTAAGENNVEALIIASQTGHRDLKMVQRYFRRRDVFRANVCSLLDL